MNNHDEHRCELSGQMRWPTLHSQMFHCLGAMAAPQSGAPTFVDLSTEPSPMSLSDRWSRPARKGSSLSSWNAEFGALTLSQFSVKQSTAQFLVYWETPSLRQSKSTLLSKARTLARKSDGMGILLAVSSATSPPLLPPFHFQAHHFLVLLSRCTR